MFLQGKQASPKGSFLITTFLVAILVTAMASCSDNKSTTSSTNESTSTTDTSTAMASTLRPQGPKPGWGPSITDPMQVVIDKLASYGAPPLETLTPQEARKQPTPSQAVMDVMQEHNIAMPAPMVDTVGKDIPVAGGQIHVRIYTPKSGNGPFPVIVYYHGGGWVIADINTYNSSAQGMAEQVSAVVISVNYRQGPEHKFPTAHNDAFAAYQWALQNAGSLKGDPKKVALVGESAGGNLACAVSIMARDKSVMMPAYQVLVYPIASGDTTSDSYQKFATAKPLSRPLMAWFFKNYLPNMSASTDPKISLVNANLKGLPPTTIIGAEIDPLQTEGKLLAEKLKDAGVTVDYKLYNGVTHEFFGMATVVPEAKDAQAMAADHLKNAFNK